VAPVADRSAIFARFSELVFHFNATLPAGTSSVDLSQIFWSFDKLCKQMRLLSIA